MESIIKVGLGVMIVKNRRILLRHHAIYGQDTGGIFEPSIWCLPGGKQEAKQFLIVQKEKSKKKQILTLIIWKSLVLLMTFNLINIL